MKRIVSFLIFVFFTTFSLLAQSSDYVVSPSLAKRITDKVLNSPMDSEFVFDYLRANSEEFSGLSETAVILRIKDPSKQRIYADNLICQYFQDWGYGDVLYLQLKEGLGCTATEFLEMYTRYKNKNEVSKPSSSTTKIEGVGASSAKEAEGGRHSGLFSYNELTRKPRLNLDNLGFYGPYNGDDAFEKHSDTQATKVKLIVHKDGSLDFADLKDTLSWTPFKRDVVFQIVDFGQYGFVEGPGYVNDEAVDCFIELGIKEWSGRSNESPSEDGPTIIKASVQKNTSDGIWYIDYPLIIDNEEWEYNSESEFLDFLHKYINKKMSKQNLTGKQNIKLEYYNRYLMISCPNGKSKTFYFGC